MDDGTPQWNYKLKQTIIDFDIYFGNKEAVSRLVTLMRQEKRLYVASFGGQCFNMAWCGRSSKGQGSKITILKVSMTLAHLLLTHQKASAQNVNFTFSLDGADSYTPFQFLH